MFAPHSLTSLTTFHPTLFSFPQLDVTRQHLRERSDEVSRLRSRNEKLSDNNTQLEDQLLSLKRQQMALNDKIVDLQGNIRVFCRVRPLLRRCGDVATQEEVAELLRFPDYNLIEYSQVPYEFDRVFPPECSQVRMGVVDL